MIVESIIGALVPVAAEGLKQLLTRFVGGVQPASVDEQIKLMQADNERIKALAALDQPGGTPSQWVIDLRGSSRYVGALAVITAGLSTLFINVPQPVQVIGLEAANIAFGFLFGTRIVANWGQRK